MMDRPIKKKFWNTRRIIWSLGIIVIVFLALYVLISAGGGSTLRVEAEKMTISTVKFDKFQEFIFENGIVTPIKTIYLDAEEGGRVKEILVEEGSFIHKGDSILLLDNTDLHLDIMYREAQLFEQINNLRNTRLAIEQQSLSIRGQILEVDYQIQLSKREFEQCETMYEKNLISKDEYDQARDNYDFWKKKRELTIETQRQDSILRAIQVEQLESSVERMQENLKVVKQKLENLVLTAPITGQLTSLNAEVGESKHRGERLGQIDVLDGFKLRAEVDEYYISRISINQKGSVEITGTNYDLNITKVYPEVKNGRFQIDLEFIGDEPDDIRRGQTVKINLALGDLSDAILIARGGFYQKTGGRWAFVLDESENFATRRNIEIGRQNPQVYEVLSGLEPGEKVITSSYDNIEHFDRIVFKN